MNKLRRGLGFGFGCRFGPLSLVGASRLPVPSAPASQWSWPLCVVDCASPRSSYCQARRISSAQLPSAVRSRCNCPATAGGGRAQLPLSAGPASVPAIRSRCSYSPASGPARPSLPSKCLLSVARADSRATTSPRFQRFSAPPPRLPPYQEASPRLRPIPTSI